MDTKKRKAAVIGALNVDIGGIPEAAFAPGDSIPGRVRVSLGGVGWNIARDLACLGVETSFFSLLGEDMHADAIRRNAEEYGVDIAHCRWTGAGNNRYLYISGRGGELSAAVNDMRLCDAMDEAFAADCLASLKDFDAAVMDANLPPETLRVIAEGAPVPLAADCVSAVKCGRLREILPYIHTIKANRMEAEMLTGRIDPADCVRALLDAGVRRAVVSLSGEGVLCGEAERMIRIPALSVTIRDVTGAGDSLTAALTAGLVRGLPLEECAELGMRAACITVGQPGAVTKALCALETE